MIISIIGMLIGALVTGAGICYLVKEKQDKESVKIYGIISGVGGVIFIAMLVKLIGYTSALKAPVRCFGNHLSGKRKSWFRIDNDCGGAAILKTRTSRMGTPVGC